MAIDPDRVMLAPLPDELWPAVLEEMRAGFAGRLNVYRTMAHHPPLLRAWAPFRDHVVEHSALGRAKGEVVILRTGHRWGSRYEWAHHVARARAAGLSDVRIEAMRGLIGNMAAEDRILAVAVDALLDEGCLDTQSLANLIGLVGEPGVLDLMATVGMYSTLAFVVKTFATPIDSDVADELEKA
jgi:4-carboxymuconolactone decarboxylase